MQRKKKIKTKSTNIMKKSINYPMLFILFIFLQGTFITLSCLTNKSIIYGFGIGTFIFCFFGFLGFMSNMTYDEIRLKQLKHLIKHHAPVIKEDTALQWFCNELFTTNNSTEVYKKIRYQITGVEAIYHYLYCLETDKKGVIEFLDKIDDDLDADWYNSNVFCVTQKMINGKMFFSILFLKFDEK